jgi:hypothetical protein
MFFNSTALDFPVILGGQFSSLSNNLEDIFEVKYLTSMIFQCELYTHLLPTTFTHFYELIAHTRFGPNWAIFSEYIRLNHGRLIGSC